MQYVLLFALTLFAHTHLAAKTTLYLIPGTGADERLFHSLDLQAFDTINIKLSVPHRKETMGEYARRLAATHIDTTTSFGILGVSLGGMIATEMADFLDPEFVVLVASAKTRHELPIGYQLNRYVPFQRLIGGRTMRLSTKLIQPLYEPMEKDQQALFRRMIGAKDPAFLNRAVNMIIGWKRREAPHGIIHIHGTDDRTLPYKCVDPTISVEGGTHMLVYARPRVVEEVLARF